MAPKAQAPIRVVSPIALPERSVCRERVESGALLCKGGRSLYFLVGWDWIVIASIMLISVFTVTERDCCVLASVYGLVPRNQHGSRVSSDDSCGGLLFQNTTG